MDLYYRLRVKFDHHAIDLQFDKTDPCLQNNGFNKSLNPKREDPLSISDLFVWTKQVYTSQRHFRQFSLRILLRRCSVASKPRVVALNPTGGLTFYFFHFLIFKNQLNLLLHKTYRPSIFSVKDLISENMKISELTQKCWQR